MSIALVLITHLLVDAVAAKLYSAVWNDTNAICPIPAHEASPAFLSPHLLQRLVYRQLILISGTTLDLVQYLEALER